jgi:hypothetical protein
MSQANTTIIYPQSTDRDLSRWQVREDEDDYGKLSRKLLELHDLITDLITDRLIRADALAEIIQTAENPPKHATRITAMLLQDLIRETQEANEKLWDEIRRLSRQVNDNKPTRH